jgi:hypothetical protein
MEKFWGSSKKTRIAVSGPISFIAIIWPIGTDIGRKRGEKRGKTDISRPTDVTKMDIPVTGI